MLLHGEEAGMVIVGAGECGARAAFALREEGYGGPITVIGAEAHLPYERPPLSKSTIMATASTGPNFVAAADRFAEAGIDLVTATEVTSIDRPEKTIHLAGRTPLPYARLLLATGATPRRLEMAAGMKRCIYLRTYEDAVVIRSHLRPGAHVAIIGGGFIGLELAASARQLGCAITVLEMQPRIMMRGVPGEIAEFVHSFHLRHGVKVHCGVRIERVDDRGDKVSIRLANGAQIMADLCIIGIGVAPNASLAEAAGLTCENGIAVDAYLATSDPDIFAAGDCCSFPLELYGGRRVRLESWRNAQDHGALAAKNMLRKGEKHGAIPWFWSDQFDWTLQITGLPDAGVETVRRDIDAGAFILFHLMADGRLVAASGIGPGNAVARDIRLAEMLIAKRARPPRDRLAASETKLKTLLAA